MENTRSGATKKEEFMRICDTLGVTVYIKNERNYLNDNQYMTLIKRYEKRI
jgi:hypothetical protein